MRLTEKSTMVACGVFVGSMKLSDGEHDEEMNMLIYLGSCKLPCTNVD